MVYFVGHCILLGDTWVPLTNVPVYLVDLNNDQSSRTLSRQTLSLQLLWQDRRSMQPLYDTVVKTHYIRVLQAKFRHFLRERKKRTLPRFIFAREIGVG